MHSAAFPVLWTGSALVCPMTPTDMTPTAASVSWHGSRLIRCLNELTVSNVALSPGQFAGRLGQLVDLADSISISAVHARLHRQVFEPAGAPRRAIVDQFLRVRRSLIQSVVASCAGQPGTSRIRLPPAAAELPPDAETAAAPYMKFYAAHQRDIDPRIQRLHADIRAAAAGLSPELAQLGALDEVMTNTLSLHRRKFFSAVPRLLGRRFRQGFEACRRTPPDNRHGAAPWDHFHREICTEMRGLLLAEIETRLLPVIGLIEAVNAEENPDIHE